MRDVGDVCLCIIAVSVALAIGALLTATQHHEGCVIGHLEERRSLAERRRVDPRHRAAGLTYVCDQYDSDRLP